MQLSKSWVYVFKLEHFCIKQINRDSLRPDLTCVARSQSAA